MRYAIVLDGIVENITVGIPPEVQPGSSAVPFDIGCVIGGTWDGTSFGPAPAPVPVPDSERKIALLSIYERMTDAEQDQIITAEASNANAKRFLLGVRAGASVTVDRIRPIVEAAYGASRADELLM